jgi:hypothetical protein
MYNKDMNPSGNEHIGLNLPAPDPETLPLPPLPGEVLPAAPETAPAGPELAAANQPPAAQPTATGVPVAAMPVLPITSQTDDSTTTQTTSISVTDDRDLIEKEWVDKAKQIVERTRDDPRQQSKELTVVRADYMQQHYNKTIKPSE